MNPRLWIAIPDMTHNNWGLKIFHPKNPDLISRAERLFKQHFMWDEAVKDLLNPFFQGGSHPSETDWKYFEFWADNDDIQVQDTILEHAMQIAEELGMQLEIGEN